MECKKRLCLKPNLMQKATPRVARTLTLLGASLCSLRRTFFHPALNSPITFRPKFAKPERFCLYNHACKLDESSKARVLAVQAI